MNSAAIDNKVGQLSATSYDVRANARRRRYNSAKGTSGRRRSPCGAVYHRKFVRGTNEASRRVERVVRISRPDQKAVPAAVTAAAVSAAKPLPTPGCF